MIELKNINKVFQINNHAYSALKNINLDIKAGEIFGVLGKSGAGKSTLLRCVNLLERPTSGEVYVNNINLTALPRKELRQQRQKIGFIFQQFNLLQSRTAFENIALPLELIKTKPSVIQDKVNGLLALVDLSDKKNHLPSQLSGGQKQRVAIARALATDPYVLLCDEATSALDTESTHSILKLFQRINRELGLTILFITHELDVIKQLSDRVGVIHKGELIEINNTLNILFNPSATITKQLVQKSWHFIEPQQLKNNVLTLKLTFIGKDSDEPLISTLAKNFNVNVNLLHAQIERIKNTTVGFTICELTGEDHELKLALQYINATSIKAEVLKHA